MIHHLHFLNGNHRLGKVIVQTALLWIATSIIAQAADPAEAAKEFLEKIRLGQVELAQDTAISAAASDEKKASILLRYHNMTHDMGDAPLRVGKIQTEGNYAAVTICRTHPFDPNQVHIFPIALIMRENHWLPAPVPGSFENTEAIYQPEAHRALSSLESWMLKQYASDLMTLRTEVDQNASQAIQKALDPSLLKTLQPKELAERFLQACKTHDSLTLLGLIGGLSNPRPNDWSERIMAVERQTKTSEPNNPWRLLSSNHSLRAMVAEELDQESALISIACLDPSFQADSLTPPSVHLLHLNFKKSKDGSWLLNLPDGLLAPTNAYKNPTDPELDRELLENFVRKVNTQNPAPVHASAADAATQVVQTLQNDDFPMLTRQISHSTDDGANLGAYLQAANLWRQARCSDFKSNHITPQLLIPLDLEIQANAAAISGQVFSARKPDQYTPLFLYFTLSNQSWLWNVEPIAEFHDWTKSQTEKWSHSWRQAALKNCPVLDEIPQAAMAPDESESRRLLDAWLLALSQGNAQAALDCCAVFNLPDSPTSLLRNLGAHLIRSKKNPLKDEVQQVFSDSPWLLASANSSANPSPNFPLYPIINTPSGPKILIEFDLWTVSNKTRDFLNRASVNRLKASAPTQASILQSLLDRHIQQPSAPPQK